MNLELKALADRLGIEKYPEDLDVAFEEVKLHGPITDIEDTLKQLHDEFEPFGEYYDFLLRGADAVQHDDYVVYDAHFNFDVHNITGAGLDATGCQHKFKQKNGYTIPYGCMVPEKIDGLLLSGRNISGTHMAHSNFRVMPICVGIGEACGAAAAIAAKSGRELREIDAAEIRTIIGEKNG